MLYHKAFVFPPGTDNAERGLVVFPLPKVACTSIQKTIQNSNTTYEIKQVDKLTPQDVGGRKCYVLTRNPFDRLVSFYLNKIKRGDRIEKDYSHEDLGFRVNMPFREMVEAIYHTPDDVSNRHFRSQTELLTVDGEFLPTHSWQFEQIDDFWDAVQRQVNVPNLDHNRKTVGRKPYKKYYTDETRKMVEERYAQDLEVFRYNF